jgi:LysR family hydrogen peroxide-inducible transcriptional activator
MQPVERGVRQHAENTLEGSSLETIRLMVATGMGITVLPYTSVSGYAHVSDLLSVRPFQRTRSDSGRGAGLAQELSAPSGH